MADTRPNVLVRLVARLKVSIRLKLLVAFLTVTLLLVGLALSGLSVLNQANERTERLLLDQDRISTYSELYGYLGDLMTLAFASGYDPRLARRATDGLVATAGFLLSDSVGDMELYLAQSVRRFGGRNTPEGQRLWELRARVKELKPVVNRIRNLRSARDLDRIRPIVVQELSPMALRLQRDVYTIVQGIEAEMAERAKVTAAAYDASRQLVIGAALAAVGFALLLGYAFSSSILWPVRRVGTALEAVARGEFGQTVSVPNRDELGTLARNVNVTSEKLGTLYDEVEAQRAELAHWNEALEIKVAEQVEEIDRTNRLRRFLPAQVAEMVVDAADGADMLRTRRSEITVLFADLRGFTTFANAATPDQVVAALNTFHGACGPLIEASGGTLERFLGDGLMVLFGAPVPMEDAAQRAVALAREMRVTVRAAMALFRAGTSSHGLGVGIGIGTGAATLGQIGFEGRLDYSAIGPAPNLAARLCDMAEDGQILISHATAWQVEAEMQPAGPFDLKGVGVGVAAFELN